MASKVLLVLTVMVLLIDGHAPRMRELRNPDCEGGGRPAWPQASRQLRVRQKVRRVKGFSRNLHKPPESRHHRVMRIDPREGTGTMSARGSLASPCA